MSKELDSNHSLKMQAIPRQTQSYLRSVFEARGLRPNSKMGQSFLVDLNLLDLIARTAELTPADLVLEVGTGTGSLTTRLAEQAGAVFGIELDEGFFQLTREITAAFPNVHLLRADVLRNKNNLNPLVLERLAALHSNAATSRMKLVANLPYVVATPVISNLLMAELPLERMVVTIQLELAERIAAQPSTKDYNALTVLVQSLADVEIVRRMPPSAFWPRPKVDSAILMIRPNAAKRERIPDLPRWQRFLHDLYLHRRKNLRGVLIILYKNQLTKEQLDAHLRAHDFDPMGRAEALPVEEHLRLCAIMPNLLESK
jgi:16S rRNA (adenine1518-N6/adenine1519-N6)-dimethyltransferase